jgi:branched-chain amino acid transport system ATP-binding protein
MLLDEITERLAPVIVHTLGRVVRTLKEQGFTMILVEQNCRFVAPLADRHYLIEHGRIVDMIPQDRLQGSLETLHAFLGV